MHVVAWVRGMGIGLAALLLTSFIGAQEPKEDKKPAVQLPVGTLDTKDWLKASTKPLEAGEIDRLVGTELARLGVKPAAQTTDEQFLRRVYLDLTGKMPTPTDVTEFMADKSAAKRAKLIDKLLETDDYARHWGQYWRSVIT